MKQATQRAHIWIGDYTQIVFLTEFEFSSGMIQQWYDIAQHELSGCIQCPTKTQVLQNTMIYQYWW